LRLLLPAANADRRAEIETLLEDYPGLSLMLLDGRSREAMAAADAVLLASGTATLEAALMKRPMVVAYRMAAFSWWLITRLVSTEYAALPNVLAGRAVVPELLQDAATPPALANAVGALLDSDAALDAQIDSFVDIHRELRRNFAERAADGLLELAHG
jgi:lipid-A-disaccharide synthase